MSKIKYPAMRKELVEHLQALSDSDYQRRIWVEQGKDGKVEHDEFDYAVHFLFDDTQLAENPGSTIGWILKDTSEAQLIEMLASAIESMFQKYGTELSDDQYIRLPEWAAVVDAAGKALSLIQIAS